jgi:hypothetical protein
MLILRGADRQPAENTRFKGCSFNVPARAIPLMAQGGSPHPYIPLVIERVPDKKEGAKALLTASKG